MPLVIPYHTLGCFCCVWEADMVLEIDRDCVKPTEHFYNTAFFHNINFANPWAQEIFQSSNVFINFFNVFFTWRSMPLFFGFGFGLGDMVSL